MTDHTPGPWRIEAHRGSLRRDRVTSFVIYSDSDVDAEGREISPEDPIGEIYGGWDEAEMRANAEFAIAAPGASLREFHNLLRIMLNIDSYEIEEAGIFPADSDDEFITFRRDPYRWFIHAEDDKARKMWTLIQKCNTRQLTALAGANAA